jgi:hypothetical protein
VKVEGRAVSCGVGELEVSSQAAGEAPAEGEAEAHSGRGGGGAMGGLVEGAEDAPALLARDTRAMVAEAQHHGGGLR